MTIEHEKVLEVPVQYLADDENMAAYIASVGGGEVRPHEGNYLQQMVAMEDGRRCGLEFSLDRQGFKLVKQTSRVLDFYDNAQVEVIYEAEVRRLVKQETAANEVVIFDHTRRAACEKTRKQRMTREPASTIHNDYTAWSGPKRLQEIYRDQQQRLAQILERRFAIVNVWRSMLGVIENFPLALCDASTTAAEDLIPVKRLAKDRTGEIQLATYNPKHKWFYFPHMTADEVLLFKTYDSAEDGRARYTIHTSFADPSAPRNAPVRQSIETRCFVFY